MPCGARRDTRKGRRRLSTYKQAVLVVRRFMDDTRMSALARDNGISISTQRGCPWRIGTIAAAALALLHHEHARTT